MCISLDGGRRLTIEMYVSSSFHKFCLKMLLFFFFFPCHQTSNISRTLAGDRIVDHWHSEVVGTLPVGTAPTTSSFLTKHLATMDWTKTTARPWTTVTMTRLFTWLIVYALCHKPQKWCHKLWNRQRTTANHWIYKLHLTYVWYSGHLRPVSLLACSITTNIIPLKKAPTVWTI